MRHQKEFESLGLTNPPGILLAGPPGCGKTTLIPVLCGWLNYPYGEVIGREDMEASDLLGQRQLVNGSTPYVEGKAVAYLEHGSCWLEDEWDKILSSHNVWLHSAMDDRRIIDIEDSLPKK